MTRRERSAGPRDHLVEKKRSEGLGVRRQEAEPVRSWGDVASALFLLAVIVVVVWQFGGVAGDGFQIQVLNPQLAWVWRVLIIAVLAVEVALLVVAWSVGRWTPALALANIAANGLGVVVTLIPLAQGILLVDDLPQQLSGIFGDEGEWSAPVDLLAVAVAVTVLAVWDSVDRARRAGLGRR